MRDEVRRWYERRTSTAQDWPVRELVERKAGEVSLVLPARDEEATIGDLVSMFRRELVDGVGLVDELVVMESGSRDATARVAADAGARVVAAEDVLPELGFVPGKGEALWKSQFVTSGDLLVFVDADLVDAGPHLVAGLLGPLLADPSVAFVKGFYERPLATADGVASHGGGRVTELVARPLLNLHCPQLAGVVQPLGGEYAGRRSVLEAVPFTSGYGVDVGLLMDVLRLAGLDGIAQVDLGRRTHRHQPDVALGRMASAVYQTVLARLGPAAAELVARAEPTLTQFRPGADGWDVEVSDVRISERPPARTVACSLPDAVPASGDGRRP